MQGDIGGVVKNLRYALTIICKASPTRLWVTILESVLRGTALFMLDVYLLRIIVNSVQAGSDFGRLAVTTIWVAGYYGAVQIFRTVLQTLYYPISNLKIQESIQLRLFTTSMEADLSCFEDSEFYDRYVKAIQEAPTRASQILDSISDLILFITYVATNGALLVTMAPELMVWAFLPVLVEVLIGKRRNKVSYELTMRVTEQNRKRDYVRRVFYLQNYAKELRLTNIYRVLFRQMDESLRDICRAIREYGLKLALFEYVRDETVEVLVYIGSILWTSFRVLTAKTMPLGDALVVINSISTVAFTFQDSIQRLFEFHEHSLYIQNLRYFLEYEPTIQRDPKGLPVVDFRGLEFHNVSFHYAGQETEVLHQVNLSIQAGEKIALVGQNGSGKSTIVKLLMRLYDPTQGEIRLNGVDIRQYRLDEYRALFGVVFQDYRIFSAPVKENVLLHPCGDGDEAIVADALQNSGIQEKVRSLPHGMDTVLTREFDEEGAVLSGGEAQKISIARIFAKDCELVIMDEPSSALDPIAEHAMYDNMMRACQNKSVIFISHRLASAAMADRIYLLENGRIVEQGSHAELMRHGGRYQEMFSIQAKNYGEKGAAI